MRKKEKVFITGATGFVGSHLIRRLVKEGYEVHILLRKSSNTWRIKDVLPKVQKHYGDVTERKKLFKLIVQIKPAIIFHLANIGIYGGFEGDFDEVINVNLLGTINMIDACNQIDYDCFINTGSSSEYGQKTKKMSEGDYCEPQSIYAITKLSGTLYAIKEAKLKKRPIVTLRLFSPYGSHDEPRRLIPQAIIAALRKEKMSITNSENVRDFIYISDVVDAYILCIQKHALLSGEIINIGSGIQRSVADVVDVISMRTNSKNYFIFNKGSEKRFESPVWQADIAKAKRLLQWKPQFSLKAGLRKTVEEYKMNLK